MSRTLKEVVVITGRYKNAQGEEKNRYQRIGSIIETKNGNMLKIDVVPLKEGGWNGWAYLNDPRQDDTPQGSGSATRPRGERAMLDPMDDESIPF